MKKGLGVAAVLVLVVVALYFFFNSKPLSPTIVAPSTENSIASQNGHSAKAPLVSNTNTASNLSQAVSSPSQTPLAARAGQVVPASNPAAELRPDTVLQNVRRAVHQYGEMFGGNPVGTNPEITSQLAGNNPKHVNFINAQTGARINGDGELVDAWGTPYFFHQMSGSETEIHSAGPDKIMWTADDLVVK